MDGLSLVNVKSNVVKMMKWSPNQESNQGPLVLRLVLCPLSYRLTPVFLINQLTKNNSSHLLFRQ